MRAALRGNSTMILSIPIHSKIWIPVTALKSPFGIALEMECAMTTAVPAAGLLNSETKPKQATEILANRKISKLEPAQRTQRLARLSSYVAVVVSVLMFL